MGFLDFLKGQKKLKPHEIMKKLAEQLEKLPGEGLSLTSEELSELETYTAAACGGNISNVYIKKPPKPDEIERCLQIAQSSNLMVHIASRIPCLEPEPRRVVSAVWGYLLKIEHPKTSKRVMIEYLINHPEAVKSLFDLYGTNTSGADVIIGVIIRDAARFSQIVNYILSSGIVYKLFPVLVSDNFDVSTDAFQTLKEVLTNHKEVSAPWVSKNGDKFFPECMKLVEPKTNGKTDYVTVRQMITLLTTIMLDRPFMDSMVQFVSNDEFLVKTLVLLGNPSKVVQYETFHLFKIFAANPRKTPRIVKLLVNNRERIIRILEQIEQDRLDDVEFKQDKQAVVAKIKALSTTKQSETTSSNHSSRGSER